MTGNEFARTWGVHIAYEVVNANPFMDDNEWSKYANHYEIKLMYRHMANDKQINKIYLVA